MSESILLPHPNIVNHIHRYFAEGQLTLREQSLINEKVTGSVSQKWSEADANILLSMMVAKGADNLKAWAEEIAKEEFYGERR